MDVDAALVRLARERGGTLITVDANLAKVAEALRVPVAQINALASKFRVPYAAGDEISVRLVKEGREHGQGVGYLDDGTMVVVEKATDQHRHAGRRQGDERHPDHDRPDGVRRARRSRRLDRSAPVGPCVLDDVCHASRVWNERARRVVVAAGSGPRLGADGPRRSSRSAAVPWWRVAVDRALASPSIALVVVAAPAGIGGTRSAELLADARRPVRRRHGRGDAPATRSLAALDARRRRRRGRRGARRGAPVRLAGSVLGGRRGRRGGRATRAVPVVPLVDTVKRVRDGSDRRRPSRARAGAGADAAGVPLDRAPGRASRRREARTGRSPTTPALLEWAGHRVRTVAGRAGELQDHDARRTWRGRTSRSRAGVSDVRVGLGFDVHPRDAGAGALAGRRAVRGRGGPRRALRRRRGLSRDRRRAARRRGARRYRGALPRVRIPPSRGSAGLELLARTVALVRGRRAACRHRATSR